MARKRLPPLPTEVWSPAGPVTVTQVTNLMSGDDGKPLDGEWRPQDRTICLDTGLTLTAAWPILMHEKVHAWLDDAGIFFPPQQLERLCNGLAQAMMAEMYTQMRGK